MPIYHCSIVPISRGKGRSAVAAAAYRSAERIADERTGLVHDYTRKGGVDYKALMVPDSESEISNRSELWNKIEASENRKNSKVAREIRVALPCELNRQQMIDLTQTFSKMVVDRYKVTADICIHQPNKQGDQRNMHAHIMISTREYSRGAFGKKVRCMDDRKQGPKEVEWLRQTWAIATNKALELARINERVDHRSYKDQGLEKVPDVHLGPTATAIDRKGIPTDRGQKVSARFRDRVQSRANIFKLQRSLFQVRTSILQEKTFKRLGKIRKQKTRLMSELKAAEQSVFRAFKGSGVRKIQGELLKLDLQDKHQSIRLNSIRKLAASRIRQKKPETMSQSHLNSPKKNKSRYHLGRG